MTTEKMLASDGWGRSFLKIRFETLFHGGSVHNQHPTPSPLIISCIMSTYKTPIEVISFRKTLFSLICELSSSSHMITSEPKKIELPMFEHFLKNQSLDSVEL